MYLGIYRNFCNVMWWVAFVPSYRRGNGDKAFQHHRACGSEHCSEPQPPDSSLWSFGFFQLYKKWPKYMDPIKLQIYILLSIPIQWLGILHVRITSLPSMACFSEHMLWYFFLDNETGRRTGAFMLVSVWKYSVLLLLCVF